MLVFLLTVALTSTVTALAAAGTANVHSVVEVQLTAVAIPLPTLKTVALLPRPNPLPVIVTGVPPSRTPARPAKQVCREEPPVAAGYWSMHQGATSVPTPVAEQA